MKRRTFISALALSMLANVMPVSTMAEGNESNTIDLKQVSVGGSTYVFANLGDQEDKENLEYKLTVMGRGGATVTTYSFADLSVLEGTDYYYLVSAGQNLIGEEVYAFTGDVDYTQSYTELYSSLGLEVNSEDYDLVSSATNLTAYHSKDIAGTVIFDYDEEGNKVISGIATGREVELVDGTSYVIASILNADQQELTEEQTALLAKKLKQNPTVNNEEVKSVSLASASYTTSRFGIGEFAIVPDDTVEGYVWSEYWDNVYGATISDGTTTVGAVHWIDLYGEAATSGPHYNKVELALNTGTSVGSNKATVNRYDAFIEDGALKPGKYTITIYADGYEDLTAVVINTGETTITIEDQSVVYNGKAKTMVATVNGSSAKVTYQYYTDEECTQELTKAPVQPGTYYVVASVEADEVYSAATSNVAKLTIEKLASKVTLKAKTVIYNGKAQAINKATVKGSKGTVTYNYYLDEECTQELSSLPVDAGTYYVTATVAADNLYAKATSNVVKLTIKQATSKVTLKSQTVKYTGEEVTMNNAVVKGSEKEVTYTYYLDMACRKPLESAPVNVGTYYVKATVASSNNYKGATSNTARFVIKK